MVRTLEYENLRQALLEELVTLYDLICAICAKPVLIAIAERDWEWQLGVAQAVHLGEAMVRKDAELERGS